MVRHARADKEHIPHTLGNNALYAYDKHILHTHTHKMSAHTETHNRTGVQSEILKYNTAR